MLMTVKEFCERHRIGKAFFYELVRAGKGPAITKIGPRCTRISDDAATEWRRQFEGRPGKPLSRA